MTSGFTAVWIWAMCGFYALATGFELGDRAIGRIISTGGHPWKHLAAAGAVLCYCAAVSRQQSARSFDNTCPRSVL